MSVWTAKVDGVDKVMADHINRLQNEKFDKDMMPFILPEDYGAIGNGVHDDTAAIWAAINVAEAAGGGTILFSDKKTYLCNQPTLLSTGVDMIFGIKSSTFL